MKRSRFTEEQVVAVLKNHELGAKPADLARKHGVSEATSPAGYLFSWVLRSQPGHLVGPRRWGNASPMLPDEPLGDSRISST